MIGLHARYIICNSLATFLASPPHGGRLTASNATTIDHPSTRAGWLKRNERLLRIAAGFFLLNQVLEFIVLQVGSHGYLGLCTWDCAWYAVLVEDGYDLAPHDWMGRHPRHDAANWVFFPALPLAGKLVHLLTGLSGAASLLLVGKLFFLMAIFAFIKVAADYRPQLSPVLAAAVVAFNPYAIYGNVGYTEPLFLLLSCAFFYTLRRNFLGAGLIGCLLACTRLVGIFSAVAYAIVAFGPWRRERGRRDLIVLGLMLFLLFLHGLTGDALAFSHAQRSWNRFPGNPFGNLLDGLRLNPVDKYWAVMCALALLAPVYFAVKRHAELAVFALLCTLLPMSTGLWAMPRYIWWQAPILLALAILLSWRKLWILFFALALPGLVYMYLSWFSGEVFVV
jgi:hypothetical protein